MSKRPLRYLILFVLFGVLSVLIIGQWMRLPFKRVKVFEAVPETTPLFVRFPVSTLNVIPDTLNPAIQAWMSVLPGLNADFNMLRELVGTATIGSDKSGNAVFAFQKMDRQQWGMSLIADIGPAKACIENILKKFVADQIEITRFKEQMVYQVNPKNGASFSLGQYRNLLIVGRFPIVVEDAIRQLNDFRGNIWRDTEFRSINKLSKTSQTPSIYLQTGFFSDFARQQMSPGPFRRLQDMESAFSWIKFDLNLANNKWQLKGNLVPATEDKKIQAFRQQEEQNPEAIFRLIPEDIAMFFYWGYSDFQKYYEAIDLQLIDRFERFIKPWVGHEIVQVVVDPAVGSSCVLLGTKDPEMAKHTLDRLLGEAGQLKAYQYNTFQVQQVLEEDLFEFLPFGPVTALRNPHFTFLEDYVLFAPSQSAMEIWLDQYVVGNTLAADGDFLQFREVNQGAFHHLLYVNADHWPRAEHMAVLNPFLSQFPYLGLGLKGKEKVFQFEANWTMASTIDTSVNLLWRVNLASESILAPKLVSLGKPENKVLVTQDAFYNFYVFAPGGELLWQKKLDGPVQAPVHAFDYYGDAQLHLLFNTPNNIYLLDEQGKTTGNFPLPLRTPASSGITFVDFKQDNNPTFFVAGQNGQVYGFDRRGQPFSGWNPLFNAGHLHHPLLHFQNGINDYLVAQSDTASIKVFAKDGALRFELVDSSAVFKSPPGYQLSANSNRIVTVDQQGIGHVLNLDGTYFRLALQVGKNESVQFAFADVIGNTDKDYIAMSGKDLAIYHYATQGFVKALTHRFEQEQDSLFTVKVLNQQKALIGTLDKKRRQVHLIDGRGKSLPGFPIAGTTAFTIVDLYGDGRPVVLGANGSAIFGMSLEGGRR